MNLPNCFICKRPVIEFKGQFEKLDTYMIDSNDDAYKQKAFGWCHSICLSKSEWGAHWSKLRFIYLSEVMGFVKINERDGLTALFDSRSEQFIILRNDGVSYSVLSPNFDGNVNNVNGLMIPVSEEMNIEFNSTKLAEKVRESLVKSAIFPLEEIIYSLGLTNTLLYPDAVRDGLMKLDKNLMLESFGNWVSAIAVYKQYLPKPVLDLVSG